MCRPEHFAVSYAINPWMDPAELGERRARARGCGPRVSGTRCIDCSAGSERKSSSFRRARRAGSRLHRQRGRGARRQGAVGALPALRAPARGAAFRGDFPVAAGAWPRRRHPTSSPTRIVLEGAGDCVWDRARGLFWMGYGPRSDCGRTRHRRGHVRPGDASRSSSQTRASTIWIPRCVRCRAAKSCIFRMPSRGLEGA